MVHDVNVFDGNDRGYCHQCKHARGLEARRIVHAIIIFDGNDCDCYHHCKHPQGLEAQRMVLLPDDKRGENNAEAKKRLQASCCLVTLFFFWSVFQCLCASRCFTATNRQFGPFLKRACQDRQRDRQTDRLNMCLHAYSRNFATRECASKLCSM